MGVIAKKHKGSWWVFINHHGKRKAKKVGEKAAALELKAKIEARLSAGDLGILDKPGITFAEAAEQWLEGYVRRRLKPRSYELYRLLAEKYLGLTINPTAPPDRCREGPHTSATRPESDPGRRRRCPGVARRAGRRRVRRGRRSDRPC